MSSSRYSIPVILTSTTDPQDRRHLSIVPGKATVIGRASRTQHTDLRPAWDNALFDSQTVSRTHAELKADSSAAPSDQITIMDRDSLHGTQVNGRLLERFKPMTLRSGDRLHFGTSVTRGHDTHDGVTVIFDRAPSSAPEPSQTLAADTSQLSKGFHVKVPSDSEDGSDEEDDYAQSIYDEDLEHLSSAHTTPEQAKTKPGSQQDPIDVDKLAPRPHLPWLKLVVDNDEKDGDHAPPRTTVQDSIDQRAKVLVPESFPYLPSSYSLVRDKLDEISASREGEIIAARYWRESLEGDLSDADDVHQRHEEHVSEGDNLQERCEDNGSDADVRDRDWDVRSTRSFLVDDAAGVHQNRSRGYSHVSEDEFERGEAALQDEEPNSYSAKKQLSPELESSVRLTADSHNHRLDAVTPDGLDHLFLDYQLPSNYFSVHPRRALTPNWSLPDEYTSGQHQTTCNSQPVHSAESPALATAASSKASTNSGAGRGRKDIAGSLNEGISQLVNDVLMDVEGESEDSDADSEWKTTAEEGLAEAKEELARIISASQSSSARKKGQGHAISPDDFPWINEMDEEDLAFARGMAALFSTTPPQGLVAGKKRKAGEITQDVAGPTEQTPQGSPARRRRLDAPAGPSVVRNVAKYAAAAAVGGVGTLAFLLSPLSLRFIEWLQPA